MPLPRRIAIVNRGEAATRLINAVRELRDERGVQMDTIALHTEAERTAMFVREADEAVCIDAGRPAGRDSPYLDLQALETALVAARADAAWAGWGFVAERPEFVELCDRLGITFIGPSAEVMRKLGDKIGAKLLAEQAGVPVAAWSGGAVDTLAAAEALAERIGYPLMIKATAGGGGRGIRRVDSAAGLSAAFDSARSEGRTAFGDPTVFIERVVADARHVEVQIIADTHGAVWPVGVRDCSLQRRNQKVIEESHCVALTAEQDADLRAAAARLAALAGYTNAGTVEFLYQPETKQFAFLEVNTRLQVEHPVTELTTGLDLVKLQIIVAAGEPLTGDPPVSSGFAVEARLNAEDPQRGFAPAPGTIELLTLPIGPGIRVDTGVAEGDVIPPEFDSMIAKIIAFGPTRDAALARLRRALQQLTVVVRGGTTNRSFLLDLLDRPEVRRAEVDTGWLDRLTGAGGHLPETGADIGLVAAAIDAEERSADQARARFFELAARGRPHVDSEVGTAVELRHGGHSYATVVSRLGRSRRAVTLDGCTVVVAVERLGRARSRLVVGGRQTTVVSSASGNDHIVEIDAVAHRFSRDDAGVVRAPAAALVVGVDVQAGDTVEVGRRLLTVEAMKMELPITAPVGGTVVDVLVARNVQVDAGTPLVKIEADADADAAPAAARIGLGDLVGDGDPRTPTERLRAFFLGFDVGAADARRAAAGVQPAEVAALLGTFADLCALDVDRRGTGEGDSALRAPREELNAFLRSCDAEREGLPPSFTERLLRALSHYAIETLEPGVRLEKALVRLFLSAQRRPQQLPVVLALLEACTPEAAAGTPLGETLDRLIAVTRRRAPTVAAVARAVRHRCFDGPLIAAARAQVGAEMRAVAEEVAAGDTSRLDRLVACPLPLLPILAEGGRFAAAPDPNALVDVLTRRYYRIRDIEPGTVISAHGVAVYRTKYLHRGRTVHVYAARTEPAALPSVLEAIASLAGEVTSPDTAVVDLYITFPPGVSETTDALAVAINADLARARLPGAVRRVAVVAAHPEAGAPVEHLTYRRAGEDGVRPYWMPAGDTEEPASGEVFEEDIKFRGLHPMIARRLQMWRLSNFEIRRLPSAEDVHLFDCVARENATDERLIAVAEVRDLTPRRDDNGRVTALPEVEQVLSACLDGIRSQLAARRGGPPLEWNRVMLYVWPVVDLPIGELTEVARRLTPLTEGLGLEQVVVSGRLADPTGGPPHEAVMRLGFEPGKGLTVRLTAPVDSPMQPLDDHTRAVIQTRRRGLVHPTEVIPMLTGSGGTFTEHDLDAAGRLSPVDRPLGTNRAGVIVGVVSTPTESHPEGMLRVALLGDPTKAMGSITEAECSRVLAAIDLAAALDVPIEWFALSAGAKIAMDSGSENLDWVARVLRRLVEHTQRGGEVNVVVAGINVGAQPYWNAEATMLMHTRGILVMTPDSAMVLTGKQAIDYSGGVSAEDNIGIGGYGRIMGPNGEAQYWAPTLASAAGVLFDHYRLTYRPPGERWPRRAATGDPFDRDPGADPQQADGVEFTTVGEVFSASANADRKKPFDIRTMINAVVDRDHTALERWPEMAEAEMAVVYDARLGGLAVTLVGIESRPLPRHGVTPADGPAQWSAGTLFPLSSKKVARAINAASAARPVVVLANLSGFDGSPESLRRLQLEYGAEIGRAIVNFDGPIVLCVVSRYHGGAFVVFSAMLNDDMEVLAVEGSFASVIGGAPAAAVVFTREVDQRTRGDSRVRALEEALATAPAGDVAHLQAELAAVRDAVRTEKLGEVAAEFDRVHSVDRARQVGSVHRIIAAADLRAELIAAVERGMARVDARRQPGRIPG